jgi:NitT/TauT family transport system substrate-binding protein
MAKPQRILALLGALAIVAGCTSGPGSTAATSPGSTPGGASAVPGSSQETGTLPTPETTDIKLAITVIEPSQFAPVLADLAGIYEKNGLNVEYTAFEGDGKGMQALQSGQVDVGFGGLTLSLQSQRTDVPVVTTMVNASILADLLMSTADVKTADDLRGKCVAVSTYGGTSHGAVILALEALGLTPDDVVITEVGGQSARIAALQGGACAAAPIDANQRAEMEKLGLNTLVDLKAEALPYGRTGMRVTEEWLAENPNTAIVFAASVLEAQNLFWTDPELVAEKFAEYTQEPDVTKVMPLIEDFQDVGNRAMTWDDAVFENPTKVLGTVSPEILDIPVAEAYDRSILDYLIESGYYEKLGVPTE